MVRKRKGLYSILMLTALLISIVTPFKAVSAAENKIKVEKVRISVNMIRFNRR